MTLWPAPGQFGPGHRVTRANAARSLEACCGTSRAGACVMIDQLDLSSMQPLRARVQNGRIVLDEPTDLPEGTEIELVPVDPTLDSEERGRLLQAIEEGAADIERGDCVDGLEFAKGLLSKREASSR